MKHPYLPSHIFLLSDVYAMLIILYALLACFPSCGLYIVINLYLIFFFSHESFIPRGLQNFLTKYILARPRGSSLVPDEVLCCCISLCFLYLADDNGSENHTHACCILIATYQK